MRLDKITIGSPKNSPTHRFKNLKNVTVDFDQDHWVTVVIGWNGTGKSNVLEALAIIFRDLITKQRAPAFAFNLTYRIGEGDETRHIHIAADPDRSGEPYTIHVATDIEAKGSDTLLAPLIGGEPTISPLRGRVMKLNAFLAEDAKHLPRYVFSYYSGESQRMQDVFRPYLESYDKKLRTGEDPGLKRLFYALPVHSQFVLLAFLIQQTDAVDRFLLDHLGIDPAEGIESVLFVLRQPPWKSKASDGDPRFWNARGVVSEFLYRLYDVALAPIEITRRVPVSLWNEKTLQFKYLYVKDISSLRRLVGEQLPADFFRDLESTYVSELIDEVRIRIRVKQNDDSITFRELSEGERQLLTVLGLLRFTAEGESLFLLDEPDTHLNPRWQYDYLNLIEGLAKTDGDRCHLVLTTHNPLIIGSLRKEQVRLLGRGVDGRIEAHEPNDDPIGIGIEGMLKSELFGLRSSLAHEVLAKIDRQYRLLGNENRTPEEDDEARRLADELNSLGVAQTHPNPYFEEFAKAMARSAPPAPKELTKEEIGEQAALADSVLREILEDGGVHSTGNRV
jgi:predicted ATPase